jgi:hypothetical protein
MRGMLLLAVAVSVAIFCLLVNSVFIAKAGPQQLSNPGDLS